MVAAVGRNHASLAVIASRKSSNPIAVPARSESSCQADQLSPRANEELRRNENQETTTNSSRPQ